MQAPPWKNANEFTDMIANQRGFQGSLKNITVSGEMRETLIDMKRQNESWAQKSPASPGIFDEFTNVVQECFFVVSVQI